MVKPQITIKGLKRVKALIGSKFGFKATYRQKGF
jgi:hypothetical protein